jgi:hypothetical protein
MATFWEYMDVAAIYSQEQERWIRKSRLMPGGEELESTGSTTTSVSSFVSSWSFLFRRASGEQVSGEPSH